MPTPKQRLETLLSGATPDKPPHWELVFQIPKEMFGIDLDLWSEGSTQYQDKVRCRALYAETAAQLVSECEWAAVPSLDPWDPEDVAQFRATVERDALVPGYENDGVFWMLPGSEMEEFAIRLYEQPEDLHREAREKCDRAKDRLRRLADAGADFFVFTYDFGYNQAPFISPRHFDDLCAPYLAELVDVAHQLGKKAILHSDGCISSLLDSIVSAGVDGYQSVDPQGHMDIRQVRDRYPDLLLMGNVPCSLLQDRDEQAIHEAVWECMSHGGAGKRYIFSTSNCIFHGMPPESYRFMIEQYRAFLSDRSSTSTASA